MFSICSTAVRPSNYEEAFENDTPGIWPSHPQNRIAYGVRQQPSTAFILAGLEDVRVLMAVVERMFELTWRNSANSTAFDMALAQFPSLPGPGPPNQWGYNVIRAHDIISQSYSHSVHVLRREDGDPLRLRYHVQRLQTHIYPIFKQMQHTNLPPTWLEESAHRLGRLLVELEIAADGADAKYVWHFF
jgi:hypothetical protein